MKKLTHIWILSMLVTIIGCKESKQSMNDQQNSETRQVVINKETLFITKVTEAFHKIIEDDLAWGKLQFVFEDHLMLTKETIKDDVLPNAYLTIRDDIFMEVGSLEDVEINGVRLSDRLIKEYDALYKEGITFKDIEKNLYKLHFAIPKFALSNPDKWKKEGRPLSAKGYELGDQRLQTINKEKASQLVGLKRLNQLLKTARVQSPKFYTIQNKEGLHLIAGDKNQGALLTVKDEETTIQAFKINDRTLYNTITLRSGEDQSTHFQKSLIDQTYGPYTPTGGCVDFYVFDCGSQEYADHRARQQALANETCETIWECIPCCSDGMGIIYMTSMYQPQSQKCKKHEIAIEIISLYPTDLGDNT